MPRRSIVGVQSAPGAKIAVTAVETEPIGTFPLVHLANDMLFSHHYDDDDATLQTYAIQQRVQTSKNDRNQIRTHRNAIGLRRRLLTSKRQNVRDTCCSANAWTTGDSGDIHGLPRILRSDKSHRTVEPLYTVVLQRTSRYVLF